MWLMQRKTLSACPRNFFRFFLITANSQLIYSFILMRSVLYEPFMEVLNVSNTEFGILMGIIGFIATFAGAAAGWLQDRFSTRNILAVNTLIYAILGLIMIFFNVPYYVKCVFFISFGFNADAMYWATVLKSVRSYAGETSQGTAFGFMEFIRGILEFAVNGIAVAIYTLLGSTVFGMKTAMTVNCAIMLLSGISILIFIPQDKIRLSGMEKTKNAFRGFLEQAKNPVVWLTGASVLCACAMYVGVKTYFILYLKNIYNLNAAMASIIALVNTAFLRIIAAPAAGLFSDKKFKNSAAFMNLCFAALGIFFIISIMLVKNAGFLPAAIIVQVLIAFTVFGLRSVYFAPIGEVMVPEKQSAAAMALASFPGYSPTFWAYPLYGTLLDRLDIVSAYRLIFMLLAFLAGVGFVVTIFLSWKISAGRQVRSVQFLP